ncbi:MAG: large conductance mechanosensitive channel protein MscL [Propionibacteriaceae bacterium]|jgi:large conductance mechanosensitive channel|nr:large conductance mechanosensitive channel protein MscL [Propionibacteriaceae bacterium]
MVKGFKEFISRGNVVDLAVGVIIGAAFGKIVSALVDGVINPLLSAMIGQPSFDFLNVPLGSSEVMFGTLLSAIVQFLLVAAAIYFCIVLPLNKLNARKAAAPQPETPADVALLTEIRDLLADKP